MLRKWLDRRIIERNRRDFLRFGMMRARASPAPFNGLSSSDDVFIGPSSENAPTVKSEGGFSEGSEDFSDDPPRSRLQLLRDWLLLYFRIS